MVGEPHAEGHWGAPRWLPGVGRTLARPPVQCQGGPGGLPGGLVTGPVWCLSHVYPGAGFSGVTAFSREAQAGGGRAFGKEVVAPVLCALRFQLVAQPSGQVG